MYNKWHIRAVCWEPAPKAAQQLFPVSPCPIYFALWFNHNSSFTLGLDYTHLCFLSLSISLSYSLSSSFYPFMSIWLEYEVISNTLSSYPKASLFNPSFGFALAAFRVQVLVEDGSVHHPEVIVCSGIQRAASKYCNKQQILLWKMECISEMWQELAPIHTSVHMQEYTGPSLNLLCIGFSFHSNALNIGGH